MYALCVRVHTDLCVFGYGQTRTLAHTIPPQGHRGPEHKIGPTMRTRRGGGEWRRYKQLKRLWWGGGVEGWKCNLTLMNHRDGLRDSLMGSESNLNVRRAAQIQSVARPRGVHFMLVCIYYIIVNTYMHYIYYILYTYMHYVYIIYCTGALWH